MIFAICLALALLFFIVWNESDLTSQCDSLLYHLAQQDTDAFQADWTAFSRHASFVTPYDLIRTANANVRQYIALQSSNADPSDVEAARQVVRSSIADIRRIHDLSLELIF